jgi:hypothetical protein
MLEHYGSWGVFYWPFLMGLVVGLFHGYLFGIWAQQSEQLDSLGVYSYCQAPQLP